MSSLGKGIATASLASLIKAHGYTVTCMKLDPYLNFDPGTMNPNQHGEVFVTGDGGECDLDLGYYERFLDTNSITSDHSVSTGKIWSSVLYKERRGDYLGQTVQVIPHITDEISRRIEVVGSKGYDIVFVEIGGTVGDIESQPFLEAVRRMRLNFGRDRTFFIHLTLVPYLPASDEHKTKPTQHSVRELLSAGIQPDLLVCRSDNELSDDVRQKISSFTNVPKEAVVSLFNVPNVYGIPRLLHERKADVVVGSQFNLELDDPSFERFDKLTKFISKADARSVTLEIGIVGKYTGGDAYKSLHDALKYAGFDSDAEVRLHFIDCDRTEEELLKAIDAIDAVVVPGGFGARGLDGKIFTIIHCLKTKKPILGICLGMQAMVIAWCRKVLKMEHAASTEMHPGTLQPVIDLVAEEKKDTVGKVVLGGTMRLGDQKVMVEPKTRIFRLYGGKSEVVERHRHRYEVLPSIIPQLNGSGLKVSSVSEEGFAETIELDTIDGDVFFIGCQYHPEFGTRPGNPHPLFKELVDVTMSRLGC